MLTLQYLLEIAGFGLLTAAAALAAYDSYWLTRQPAPTRIDAVPIRGS